jgi:hypothetical protein
LSTDFPTQNPYQATNAGLQDGFISVFNSDASSLDYSTYFGGTGTDRIRQILIDSDNDLWFTGITDSSDLPLQGPIQAEYSGEVNDAFVSKISADGTTLLFSTYLGGNADDQTFTINVDAADAIYVSGLTNSKDFPTANAFQPDREGRYDAFIVRFVDVFAEDFSDGNSDGWTFKNGNWTVVPSGGGFALSGNVSKKGEANAPDFILGVGSLEADIQIQTAKAQAILRGWLLGKKNYVELKILERDKLILTQKAQGGGLVRQSVPFTIDVNTTYHFQIVFDGQNFQVFVNNNPTAVITMPSIAHAMGGLSFRIQSVGAGSATVTITNILAN